MRVFPGIVRSLLAAAVAVGIMGGTILAAPLNTPDRIAEAPVNIPSGSLAPWGGVESATFDILRAQISDVAAGRRTNTVFQVPADALGLPSLSWTAAELGVSTIVSGGVVSREAQRAALGKVTGDYNRVIAALLNDCPFELFWYDKAPGVDVYCTTNAVFDSRLGQYVMTIGGNITYCFEVYASCAAGPHEVNPAYITRAQAAANNARAIVNRYAGLSDYEKLAHYRDEICALVSYDYNAVNLSGGMREPWQLVNVFDGDPSTNVVCEGYSKAFKYLCDISSFSSGLVSCLIVSGEVAVGGDQGSHMWNVVRMDDGACYVVDLTNYDDSFLADPSGMFLGGCTGGSADGGYYFVFPEGTMTLTYNRSTKLLYSGSALTLATAPYVPVAGGYAQPVPVDVEGASAFIERLYTVALGRESDPVGAQYWLDRVVSGNSTGADLARGFLFSQEFLGKNMSNDDFLTILYRTFFDREADPAGRAYWNGRMNSGMSRQDVISGFINSVEWHNLCTSYGIRSGSAAGGYT